MAGKRDWHLEVFVKIFAGINKEYANVFLFTMRTFN